MAWVTSDRLERLPDNWPELRDETFRIKGKRCLVQWDDACEIEATEVDHIVPGDDHRIENRQPVCERCHQKKSSAEGNAAKARLKALRKRPTDRHPGLM